MASINDNLFTTLVHRANEQQIGCRLPTRWGRIGATLTDGGLSALYFDDRAERTDEIDCVVREAFLAWLGSYQAMRPAEQWDYLSPAGTDYQQSVWRHLLELPLGQTQSYGEFAASLGTPKAARAVGSAVAANPICLLIPCHRIINASGSSGNYRWGADRKLALLDAERTDGCDLLSLFQ